MLVFSWGIILLIWGDNKFNEIKFDVKNLM